jgi:hypothetical protein
MLPWLWSTHLGLLNKLSFCYACHQKSDLLFAEHVDWGLLGDLPDTLPANSCYPHPASQKQLPMISKKGNETES